jgi:hypothetical protein
MNSAKSAPPSNPSSALRAPDYEYGGPWAVLGEDSLCTPAERISSTSDIDATSKRGVTRSVTS